MHAGYSKYGVPVGPGEVKDDYERYYRALAAKQSNAKLITKTVYVNKETLHAVVTRY